MSSKIYSVELSGLDGQLVEIEVDTRMSMPSFSIVGLPDAAVMEAKERVMSAVKNAGYALPRGRIVVNLAPADLKKVGARYDVPIALGLIAFSQPIGTESFKDTIFLGELALNGTVRPITGVLASTEFAKRRGFRRIFVPKETAKEAAIIPGIEVLPIGHIKEAILHLKRELSVLPIRGERTKTVKSGRVDMAMIRGQTQAKRALEIAAAGGHNVLFNGAPGAGKTLMAKALRGLLPDMTQAEMLEVTKIYSVAGLLPTSQSLIDERPFRSIHHTASAVSIVGGGNVPVPGEITLAHRGILFMDEIAEFPGQVLEVLRQPMEDRQITISRARATITYPADFTLIGAMNPCPCGYFNVIAHKGRCDCPRWKIQNYYKRLSGPLLDRIDMHLLVEPVEHEALTTWSEGAENSEQIRARVNKAYRRKTAREAGIKKTGKEVVTELEMEKFSGLSAESKSLLSKAVANCGLSARTYFKIIKLSRTIADLDDSESVNRHHAAEAVQYLKKNN